MSSGENHNLDVDNIAAAASRSAKFGAWKRCEKCQAVNHEDNRKCWSCGKEFDDSGPLPSLTNKGVPPAPFGASMEVLPKQKAESLVSTRVQ